MTTKIAVTGVQGGGKSHLCNHLKDVIEAMGNKVALISEVTEHCPYRINKNATADTQEWLWHEQLKQELIAQNSGMDVIVCDRSLIDHLVYMKRILDKKRNVHQKHIESNYGMLYAITVEWMTSYDYVVRLPLDFDRLKSKNNALRDSGVMFAKEIDRLFDEVVSPFVNIHKDDLLAMVKNEL